MLRPLNPKARYGKDRQIPHWLATAEQFDHAVDSAVLGNLMPEAPFIDRTTNITTIGSCFAGNIAASLKGAGYNIHFVDIAERLFNPFALKAFIEALRGDNDLDAFTKHWALEPEGPIKLRNAINHCGVLIITFGLSFVWIDKTTNKMVFDPTQKDGKRLIAANPERFVMEATGVAANVEAMAAIINAVTAMNRNIKIVLTLSPVHLARAITDYPAAVADAISKSTLRCALHEIMNLRVPNVYYFPSFEILRWFGPMVDVTFGAHQGAQDIRHINPQWVDYTLSKFRQYYCVGEKPILPPYIHRELLPAAPHGTPAGG